MDTNTPESLETSRGPAGPEPAANAPSAGDTRPGVPAAGEPEARFFGLPIVIWVLIGFVVLIAVLTLMGLVSGDML